ncbi:MAG: VOC family protein [Cellvibrio sp.]|uniref:VOC family protein n=1 Tax=Cellvibrio sp. TaxID=1965322 RepID=UPI0031AFFAEB
MAPNLMLIDHVHVSVKDRKLAEQWYKDVLGFERVAEFDKWATDKGPLTIGNAQGNIHLALFESENIQNTVIAFSVTAENFFAWIEHLNDKGISVNPIDHDLSWSIYFRDPDGNPFEITTYEYAAIHGYMEWDA